MDEPILNAQIDSYFIEERIKAGGMAVVYKARDAEGNPVALKLLQASWMENEEVVKRFQIEADIMRELRHPHIVNFLGTGEYQNRPYIAMEYMAGGSLSERLRAIAKINLQASARLLAQIGSALSHAHNRSIVHRDLKPGNILMRDETHAALTDFGIARVMEMDFTRLTLFGQMPGTPHYMSPEQARGEIQDLDQLSDLYSFTVIAYLLTTGTLPFMGSDPLVIINQHLMKTPPRPTEVNPALPTALDEVLLKGLEKDPKLRYPSIKDFVEAYQAAIEGHEELDIVITAVKAPRSDGSVDPTPHSTSGLIFSKNAAVPEERETTRNPVIVRPPVYEYIRPTTGRGRLYAMIAFLGVIGILGLAYFIGRGDGNDNNNAAATQQAIAFLTEAAAEETESASNTPTASATATRTATPSLTPNRTATAEAAASETAGAVATATENAVQIQATFSRNLTATADSWTETPSPTTTPTETVTSSPTLTSTPTATFTSTPTVTPSSTPTSTPSATVTTTPSPTRTPRVTPGTSGGVATATPLFSVDRSTLQDVVNSFRDAGRAGSFNCLVFVETYNFLQERLTANDVNFEAARILVDDDNDPVREIYELFCQDDPINERKQIDVLIHGDMRTALLEVENSQ